METRPSNLPLLLPAVVWVLAPLVAIYLIEQKPLGGSVLFLGVLFIFTGLIGIVLSPILALGIIEPYRIAFTEQDIPRFCCGRLHIAYQDTAGFLVMTAHGWLLVVAVLIGFLLRRFLYTHADANSGKPIWISTALFAFIYFSWFSIYQAAYAYSIAKNCPPECAWMRIF